MTMKLVMVPNIAFIHRKKGYKEKKANKRKEWDKEPLSWNI